MKPRISLFLSLCLLAVIKVSAYDAHIGGIYYNFNGDDAEVTFASFENGQYHSNYPDTVKIPASVPFKGKTYPVTSIGNNAFSGCHSLNIVTIPNSVTSISDYAFYSCLSLSSIAIPSSVTSIGDYAFHGCRSLSSISIPNSVTSLGSHAFELCRGLTTATIGNGITCISDSAFLRCSGLTSVFIPNSVTEIGISAFERCESLSSVTIPNSVTTLKASAFHRCYSLTSIAIPNNVTSIGDTAFAYCTSLNSVHIGSGVTSIGYQAFIGCESLTSINIPNNVTYFDDWVFAGCSALTSVTWPNSVTEIRTGTFSYCTSLASITIPNSVTSIGKQAFERCYSLTSITIPNSVTSIGALAFRDCKGLTSVTIPNSVTYIAGEAFFGCSALTSVVIPNSITTIPDGLFHGCTSLTSFTIPNNITSIRNNAFQGCTSLTSITIPNSVTSIGPSAFFNSGLTSITIPSSVTSISWQAFMDCTSLTSVTIPYSITSINDCAFQGCTALTDVYCYAKNVPRIASNYNVFEGTDIASATLHVSMFSLNAYRTTEPWSGFGNIVAIEPTVLQDLSNDKLYTLECKRGYMVLTDDATGLAAGQTRTWATDAEKRFAIITYNGAQYLYSPVNKQYLLYDGHFVSRLGSPIIFDDTQADGDYKFMIITQNENGEPLYFNNNGNIVIDSWDTPDDGNRWRIEPVDDFDPSEALALAAFQTFTVTYNVMFDGKVVATATEEVLQGCALPPPPASLSNSFITLTKTGSHPTTVTEDITLTYSVEWSGPFEFTKSASSAKWYNMNIRSGWYVGKQETEPYYPAQSVDEATLATPAYQWAFGGDPYHVKVYNRTTGLNETLTKVGDNAVMRSGDYTWDLLPNNDGFVLRVTGTENCCINQYGGINGPLKFWTDSQSLTDDGSTFRVKEVAIASPAIEFADANVKALCVANWDTNGDGELSEAEAAEVTDLGTVFKENTTITSFNELQYFTGLSSIGESAFDGCINLTSITIPSSVTNIGGNAFQGCCALNVIYCYAEETPEVSSNTFSGVNVGEVMLVVPDDAVDRYKAHPVWGKFRIETPTGISSRFNSPIKGGSIYDLSGRKQDKAQKGINILRMSDGATRKLMIK